MADEAVVIVLTGLKAADIDLNRVVSGRVCHRLPLGDDGLEARIGGQFPAHNRLGTHSRADPRPKDQPVAERITAGDAVGKDHLGVPRRGRTCRQAGRSSTHAQQG